MTRLGKRIGYWVLQRRFSKINRDKSVQNFSTATDAVIIFDTLLPGCFPPVKEFVKYLKQKDINTFVLGYVSEKEIPHEMLLWPDIEFLTRKDVNWYGAPKGEIADRYFGKNPDMLFVLRFRESVTIEFLTRLSEARFKIGCYTEEENDLDLMIKPSNKDCEVGYFLEQVKHYINMLNPSK